MEKPLYEALERLNILIVYLNSDISWDEAVRYNDTLYHVLARGMRVWVEQVKRGHIVEK